MMFVAFLPMLVLAQDEFDMDDEGGAEDVNFDVECTFEAVATPFDDFKYSGDLAMGIKIWYSDAASAFKKWRKEKDAERRKNYEAQIEKYSWQVLVSDPEHKNMLKLKSGPIARNIRVAERLGEVYLNTGNAKMLGAMLAKVQPLIGSRSKLNRYAITYFNSSNNHVCEAKQYASWLATIPKTEKNKSNLGKLYTAYAGVLNNLGARDKALEAIDEYLAFDVDNLEMQELRANLSGSPEEQLEGYRKRLAETPDDYVTMERAALTAMELEENDDAKAWFLKLLEQDNTKESYKKNLVLLSYKMEKMSDVIKYGKGLSDTESRELVIKAYITRGQFKSAFNVASAVQRVDGAQGHYLKGLVYEETANAAQDDSTVGKRDFEWRLIYRLSNIEYLRGGVAGKQRAKKINALIPNKGAIFLKQNRIKPNAGKFSSWITWVKAYDKKIYGPDM